MSLIPAESGNPNRTLQPEDYKASGELKDGSAELALVLGSVSSAESFISSKQWGLLWRDADLLFQSPRPKHTWGFSL